MSEQGEGEGENATVRIWTNSNRTALAFVCVVEEIPEEEPHGRRRVLGHRGGSFFLIRHQNLGEEKKEGGGRKTGKEETMRPFTPASAPPRAAGPGPPLDLAYALSQFLIFLLIMMGDHGREWPR